MMIQNINSLYPDFLLVGAAKSGTSSLHYYFKEHPEICMPKQIKELNFFHLYGHEKNRAILKRNKYLPTNILSYLGFFYHKKTNQISGECSPSYLYYYKDTVKNIKALHPNYDDLKIIIILREPIDKIWSHYKFVTMKNLDPKKLSLKDSIRLEKENLKNTSLLPDLFYIDNTSYYCQVKHFMENFNNVKIVKYDDLKENPKNLMKEIFEFLGCSENKKINFERRYNKSSSILKFKANIFGKFASVLPDKIFNFLPKNVQFKWIEKETINPDVEKLLAKHFYEEITKLQKLTGISFKDWLLKYEDIENRYVKTT